MPISPPAPVDIDRLLRVAQGRRRTMRGRCTGDRFRAAMAVLKQEKERMRGKWSLDSTYEWPDDGDDTPCGPPLPAPSASLPPVPRFVSPRRQPRTVSHTPVIEPQFHRTVLHFPDATEEDRTPPPGPLPVPGRGCSTRHRSSTFRRGFQASTGFSGHDTRSNIPSPFMDRGPGGKVFLKRPPAPRAAISRKFPDCRTPRRALGFVMPTPFTRLASRLPSPHADGDLLARFHRDRDEAAFGVLVHRHGPTVYGVCRRILGNGADADDAFQAVFLVLVNRAESLAHRPTLGDWLHGVAVRVAMKARTAFARLRKHERRAAEGRGEAASDPPPDEPSTWLDRELAALPDKFRVPVVLCLIQDRPRGEVAAELGIPEGTLASRLDAARKRLAGRLARHHLPLAAVGLLVPVPAALADATVGRAAGGTSVAIQQLAHEVTTAMISKTKWAALVAAGVLTAVIGAAVLTAGIGDRAPAKRNAPVPEKKPPAEPVWVKAFRKAYELRGDEYVKRVAPPHIKERRQFLVDHLTKRWGVGEEDKGVVIWLTMGALFLEDDGKAITHKVMLSTRADDPMRPDVQIGPKMVRLPSVIGCCTNRTTPEVVFDNQAEKLDVCMDGDFVIRKGAPLEKLVPDLQTALRECDLDVVLTVKEVEQEVLVVGGKFALKPREWREKDEVDVYADEEVMNKGYSHKSPDPHRTIRTQWDTSTSVAAFARSLGEFLDKRVVLDADGPAVAKFHWYIHNRWDNAATAAEKAADRDPAKVLKAVTEQTGLTFKTEKRKVPVLHVGVPKK